MPNNLHELAEMLAKRDGISYEEELEAIRYCGDALADAFMMGNLNYAEDILREELGLEPDYLMLFIN